MPSIKHTHIYQRYKKRSGKLAKEWWFMCADPLCTHFADYEQVLGKQTRCTSCGATFILDKESVKRVKPRCLNCAETKKALLHQRAGVLLTHILPDDDLVTTALSNTEDEENEPWL